MGRFKAESTMPVVVYFTVTSLFKLPLDATLDPEMVKC